MLSKYTPEKRNAKALSRLDRSNPDGCWPWTGSHATTGYGTIWDGQRTTYTHRFFYELLVGPIPPGMYVCHRCDNPPCCRPAHLFLGTNRDNSMDMLAKGRHPQGALTPPERRQWGEAHHNAKLTEAAIRDIRSSRLSRQAYANLYSVSKTAIRDVVMYITWPHVT